MSRTFPRLPSRFPPGSTYILERRGTMKGLMLVHRYVRFPDGRQIDLSARLVPMCRDAGKAEVVAPAARPARSRSRRRATTSISTD